MHAQLRVSGGTKKPPRGRLFEKYGGALFAFFFVAVVGRLVMAFGDYNEVAEFAFVLLQFFLREDFDVEFVFVVVN